MLYTVIYYNILYHTIIYPTHTVCFPAKSFCAQALAKLLLVRCEICQNRGTPGFPQINCLLVSRGSLVPHPIRLSTIIM